MKLPDKKNAHSNWRRERKNGNFAIVSDGSSRRLKCATFESFAAGNNDNYVDALAHARTDVCR